MPSNSKRFLTLSLLITLLTPVPALAYIDPNTGGMLFQMLAPLLAAVTGAWLFARDKIKAVFYRLRRMIFPARASEAPSSTTIDPS
jgi:hypothetical protein